MPKPPSPSPSFTALLLFAAMTVGPAQAERADRGKKLVLESDAATVDALKQVTVLTGNVVITKGTLVIKADRVEVREGADGFRNAVAIGGSRQATFRQKRDGVVDEYIDGQADRLEYEERREAIRFVDNATVRVLRGAVVGDEITGNLVTYDGTSDVYSVSGGVPRAGKAASSAGNAGKRVRVELTPKDGTEAAAVGAQNSAKPAAAAVTPARSGSTPGDPR